MKTLAKELGWNDMADRAQEVLEDAERLWMEDENDREHYDAVPWRNL